MIARLYLILLDYCCSILSPKKLSLHLYGKRIVNFYFIFFSLKSFFSSHFHAKSHFHSFSQLAHSRSLVDLICMTVRTTEREREMYLIWIRFSLT